MCAARAALKNPLCADKTPLCAEKCVIPGPTCNETSGAPGTTCPAVGNPKLSVDEAAVIGGGGGNDNQALYNEYIFFRSCRPYGMLSLTDGSDRNLSSLITIIQNKRISFWGGCGGGGEVGGGGSGRVGWSFYRLPRCGGADG